MLLVVGFTSIPAGKLAMMRLEACWNDVVSNTSMRPRNGPQLMGRPPEPDQYASASTERVWLAGFKAVATGFIGVEPENQKPTDEVVCVAPSMAVTSAPEKEQPEPSKVGWVPKSVT